MLYLIGILHSSEACSAKLPGYISFHQHSLYDYTGRWPGNHGNMQAAPTHLHPFLFHLLTFPLLSLSLGPLCSPPECLPSRLLYGGRPAGCSLWFPSLTLIHNLRDFISCTYAQHKSIIVLVSLRTTVLHNSYTKASIVVAGS